MRKLLLMVVSLFVATQVVAVEFDKSCEYLRAKYKTMHDLTTQKDIECFIDVMSQSVNEKAPMKVDKITTVSSTYNTGLEINYNYSLDLNLKEKNIDKTIFKNKLIESMANYLCSQEDMLFLIKKGMIVTNKYVDDKQIHLFQFSIDKKVCEIAGFK